MQQKEPGVATDATEMAPTGTRYRLKRYKQYRDRLSGQYIREEDAELLPPRRILVEQRTLIIPIKEDSQDSPPADSPFIGHLEA